MTRSSDMKKSPQSAAPAGEFQPETARVQTATTFVFPSAPPAPTEYAFVDGDDLSHPPTMPRNGATVVRGSQHHRPPPPYVFGRISSHVYDMIDPKSGHEWMFRVALIEFILAVLATCCAISCVVQVDKYCPYYTGVWVAIIFLVNSVLGVLAAKSATVNFFVAHLVTSVLALVASVILLALSIHNWNEAGYKTGDLCIFSHHDVNHIRQNVWNNPQYPYGQCVYDFKLGLTFNTILMICAVLEGMLSLASTIFCFKAVCHCTNWRYPRR